MNADQLNVRSGEVVDAAMRVHSALGPGLLESAYRLCLTHELQTRGLQVDSEVVMPLVYRGVRLDAAYRVDMLVDKELIVELKSIAALLPVHEAQLLSYLRLSSRRLGLLINFNVPHLKDGIKRLVNNLR